MKKIHLMFLTLVIFVCSLSVAFGYNKAEDGTYYADFNGDGKHDIFLYDRITGTGVIWGWDGEKWETLWKNDTFKKTWKIHLGDFDGDGTTDMFLYDNKDGTGVVLTLDASSKAGAKRLWKNTTFNKEWDIYVGNFTQEKKSELFLYDKKAGVGVIFGWDGEENFKSLWKSDSFKKTWAIHPGDFDGDGKSDMFLYDKKAGVGVIWGWSGEAWQTLWKNKTFRKTWQVHVGDFNGDKISDMFLYDNVEGKGILYSIDPKAKKGQKLWENNTFKKTWDIYTGDFTGIGKTALFLYDKKAGTGVVFGWDGGDGGDFKNLWKSTTFKKTWDLYPGDFNGDSKVDIFLYDKKAGIGNLYGWKNEKKDFGSLWKNKTFKKTWNVFTVIN